MLETHIKELYTNSIRDWSDEKSEALATMIYTRGIQAEISSVRTYLNIVHNFYTFLIFNSSNMSNPDERGYIFNPESDIIVHLLIVKEAWQSLYEGLVREALKNRLRTIRELVEGLIEHCQLAPEQLAFLRYYFVDPQSAFIGTVFADLLFAHPTLA